MKTHSVLSFLIFTCFLVVGYTFSLRFYQPDNPMPSVKVNGVTSENQDSLRTMENGQRSLLLISASAIDTLDPRLESIWLATYLSSDTTIQLLPIFPRSNNAISDLQQQLEQAFNFKKVDGKLALDPAFMRLLQDNNYWWSGYILFDEVSLAKVFTLLGGVDLHGKNLAGAQPVTDAESPQENQQHRFSSQVAILQSMCHKLSSLKSGPDVTQLMSLVPGHILTDLDASQLQLEIDSLHSNQHNPVCRFPTLEISRIEP